MPIASFIARIRENTALVHRAAFLLGGFTLLAQILAVIRDRLLAGQFGAGRELDVYYTAFRIPDLLFITIGSLVSVSVIVPMLLSYKDKDTERIFLKNVCTAFILLMSILAALLAVCMPLIAPLIAPGFSLAERELLISLARILLIASCALGFSSLLAGIAQAHDRFTVSALTPTLYNIGIILGIIFLAPTYGIFGVGIGVVLGAFFHAGVQAYDVAKGGHSFSLTYHIDWRVMKDVCVRSIPRTITLLISQVTFTILIIVASFSVAGSITLLQFAWNIQSVPLAIIGASYAVAAFPTLARFISEGNNTQFAEHLGHTARHILLWAFPAIAVFIILREHIVRALLGAGSFTWNDTHTTGIILACFIVSLVPQALSLLFLRAHYAFGKTWSPLLPVLLGGALTVAGVFLFAPLTEYVFMTHIAPVFILPIAFSVGAIFQALGLWFLFPRAVRTAARSSHSSLPSVIAGTVTLSLVMIFVRDTLIQVFTPETFLAVVAQGLISGTAGLVAYVTTLLLLKNKEVKEYVVLPNQKDVPLAPEPEHL